MIKKSVFRKILVIPGLLGLVTGFFSCGNPTTPTSPPVSEKTINQANWDPAGVPDGVITQAAALDCYFQHASVGANFCTGLDDLAAEPGSRYKMDRTGASEWIGTGEDVTPAWFDTHSGLADYNRGNPDAETKARMFAEALSGTSLVDKLQVASFKFCYIDNPEDASALFDTVKAVMEKLEADHPATVFLWWTMPIETQGHSARQQYNDMVRDYCNTQDKWLFDIAALESHDDAGTLREDEEERELLVEAYSSDGGHLNAAGSRKLALAWWKLLAEVVKDR